MKKLFTRKYLLLIIFFSFCTNLIAQVSIPNTSTAVTQNFNTLAQSGTTNTWADNTTIAGWYSNRIVYIGDPGTSTTGALYSYGTTAASDRGLGLLSSSTTTFQFAVRLVNNTGFTLSGISLSYKGEQWRQTANAQSLVFESQVGATAIGSGTWIANTAFNFTAPKTGTAGSLDGNATGNFSSIIGTLNATIINGQEIWLRWTKTGTSSPGLAIDDFSITGIAAISSDATLSNLTSGSGALTPAFTPSTINYTSSVANAVTSTTVTPTATDANSTIKVNGVTVASGSASSAINLNVGSNTITTVVTAQDGTTTKTYSITITRATAGTPLLNTTSSLGAFGNVCINTTPAANSFTLDGNDLDGTAIAISALSGYTFSETLGGTYTNTLSFSYTGTGFTGKIIYVQFSPTVVQSYDGNIVLNGGGVSNYNVAASGTGVNTSPTVTTTGSTNIIATSATLSGVINTTGCSSVSGYGFEYSTTSGFPNGSGIQVVSSNISGGNFSAVLSNLAPNTRYYYKAFATNNGGTSYGSQLAFTCTALPVVMATQPGLSFTETFADIANWSNFFITGIGANHFTGLGPTGVGNIPNGTTITASTFSFQNSTPGPPVTPSALGGVHKGTDQTVPTQSIILLSTGTTDNTTSAAIDFYMDFTGVNAGTLSFDYAVVNNQAGDRIGSLRVYASIDGITFTDITFASVLNFSNNIALTGSKSNIALPAIFNNNANARLRFYYSNGIGGTTGSRPKISIDNLNVTALASTPCAIPTAAATNLVFGTITDTTISASFTASNPATDSYLIVMSVNSSLISNPINNQNYAIGDNVGDGTVIAKINGTSFTASNLNPLTTYYFFIFPMNAICTGGPLYYTTSILTGSSTTLAGLPNCVAPLTQPTNLMFGTTTSSSINGSFTATTADKYLVVKSLSASLGATPTNGQNYNSGNTIGNGSVVQNSAITTFTASGLAPNTLYNFFIFSLNSQSCINGPVYNSNNPLTATHSTIPLPLCVTPASQPTNLNLTAANTQVSGTYTGVSGADDYLVIKSTSVTLGTTPIDNTDYAAGDVFGNGTVVTNTGNTTFLANNLSIGTTYYFFVFAANKTCSGGTKYATQSPLAGNIVTTNNTTNNFYFGTLHSHSDYSDGNKDNPGFTPAQDYDYAKNALCMDYLGISEHNHFSSPDNPGNQINNFHQGSVQANNFITANPTFLALYGMEWGVISGGGHVVIYGDGMDDLWGWETGGGTWGPTNNYDVFVPKSIYKGNTGLFKTVNDNIATKTFATLAHPSLGDFNRLDTSYDAIADNAIVGTAVESGPAFSTNTTYSNPGSSLSYLFYYQLMLAKGYRLGPTIDHDNHNTTFGRTTTSRTAIIAPVITKTAFVNAMRNMNFYATQDCDTKVDFTINTKIMGSIITDRSSPNISVSLTDVSTPLSSAIIRLMYGVPGSNINATQIDSSIGNTLQFNHAALTDLATGYYYIDVTNGTSRVITSPIWYTRNDANALPVKLSAFTVQKAGKSAQLDWTTEQETNSSHFIIQRSTDGRKWNDIANVIAAVNSSIRKEYRVYDNAPINGVNYYRLKQFDVDGKFEYSFVKSVSFNKDYNITITPNPAKDFIYISTTINQNTILTIQLVDVSGKVLKSLQSTQPLVKISTAGIAKGLYFIKIKDENTVQTQRIVIE